MTKAAQKKWATEFIYRERKSVQKKGKKAKLKERKHGKKIPKKSEINDGTFEEKCCKKISIYIIFEMKEETHLLRTKGCQKSENKGPKSDGKD
jgi:hypothetical protein